MDLTEVTLTDLTPHPKNPNTHPVAQIDALGGSLSEFDQVKNVVVWRGFILAGHALIEAAQKVGLTTLQAQDVSDWNEDRAIAFMLADIRLPGMAIVDESALVEALRVIDQPLDIPGFDEDFLKGLEGWEVKEPPKDMPPDASKADELQKVWGTELGQTWSCAPHRVACGDCTDRAVVGGLMENDKGHLFLTDPPYGVSYADKNAFLNTLAKGNAVQKRIDGDHQSMDDMKTLWYLAAKNACDFSEDTAAYYWFACQGGDQMMMMMMMMIGEAGWKVRHELIWVKNNHVLGRSDYNYKHEPILYGWKKEGTHKFYGDFQTSILEFDKPLKSDLHPTMKPISLVSRLIENSSQTNELIYDPFLGSGTTLIAAHQLNRRCFGIELDPGYVAVCLQRFLDHTNIQPELIK